MQSAVFLKIALSITPNTKRRYYANTNMVLWLREELLDKSSWMPKMWRPSEGLRVQGRTNQPNAKEAKESDTSSEANGTPTCWASGFRRTVLRIKYQIQMKTHKRNGTCTECSINLGGISHSDEWEDVTCLRCLFYAPKKYQPTKPTKPLTEPDLFGEL